MSNKRTDFTNDDIAARAIELAKADDCVVWQRYVPRARKQLELETDAARLAAPRSSTSTPAELLKAEQDHEDRLTGLAKRSATAIAR
jgi:hypothetical protein